MNLKQFLSTFDPPNPNWNNLPPGFLNADLAGLTSEEIGRYHSIKTFYQLQLPPKPSTTTSRAWQDPKGYQYLAVWQNAALLRIFTRKFTLTLPLNGPLSERRLKAQMDDCSRSVKRNIEEGWKRSTSSEYLQFLGYSQGSLEELKGDIRDCKTDGFLKSIPHSSLAKLGFRLTSPKGPSKGQVKGEPTESRHLYHIPLSTLKSSDLTYEVFMELCNKTDYLLRQTVKSLETKLNQDRKHYQVQKLRHQKTFGWTKK